MFSWLKTIIILPFNVIIVIPAVVLWLTGYHFIAPAPLQVIIWAVLFLGGVALALWTMLLFAFVGDGTAAPWNPPKNLVVKGPYRHVRNPMITSVLMMVLANSILLSSWAIFSIFILFFVGNMIYFPLFEEKGLIKRFGQDYILYKNNVPRWLPRLTPWSLPK